MKKTESSGAPPAEFLARMGELLPPDEFDVFRAAFDEPPRVGLRVNTLKISVAHFTSIAPFSLAPAGEWDPAAFFVLDDSRPGRHPYHDAGLYYLQEPSAMLAAATLAPEPGEIVLDLAAAPGGKATHLTALMAAETAADPVSALRRQLDTDGLLVANDVHGGRSRLLADNLARWGALNALVTHDEPERLAAAFGPAFDRVLIDAPCSGEGMIRRRESLEWSEAIVAACSRRQRAILSVVPDLLRPGGRLLYATCTFAPEENEQVIAAFLAGQSDFHLVEPRRFAGFERGRPDWAGVPAPIAEQLTRAIRLWPHRFPGEGHFLALMARDGDEETRPTRQRPFRHATPTANELRLWSEFAAAALALSLPAERLHAHNGRLYLLPKSTLATGHTRIVRYGLFLGEFRPGRFHPSHDLALALNAADVASAVDRAADDPLLAAYLRGEDEAAGERPPAAGDWTLMCVDGFGIGWSKAGGGRLKNHYPRHLRKRA